MQDSYAALRALRAFAEFRRARGDQDLVLNPVSRAQEETGTRWHDEGWPNQGLVLEPHEDAPFHVRPLANRRHNVRVAAFCDGIRTTYPVGYEQDYPLNYARNAAAVRVRDPASGYHSSLGGIERRQETLLAPLAQLKPAVAGAYRNLGLVTTRLADLCYTGDDEERAYQPTPIEMQQMGSLAWQERALRRARRLLDISEQVVAVAGAAVLRESDPSGRTWLLKDGSLFQFDKHFLKTSPEQLHRIVSCVKTHPVLFFGVEGERQIARMKLGERSVAFLPRPSSELKPPAEPTNLKTTTRPMITWYLRVKERDFKHANMLNGIIRLDIAATPDWRDWVDEISWAVLDEFYGISAMPDPRADVMPYGIYECEQSLKSQQLPGDLLLAELG